MRPIDADALHSRKVSGTIGNLSGDFVPGYVIDSAPTIDAAPVVHARWVKMRRTEDDEGESVWECSNCGYPVGIWTVGNKYCPDCGAKMDAKEDEK